MMTTIGRRWTVHALALAALAVAVLALGARPAAAEAPEFGAFPSLTLKYHDQDGEATVQINAVGADDDTNGTRIHVTLQQHGRGFSGKGFMRAINAAQYVGSFYLSDHMTGTDFLFTGTFVRGFAGWTGEGRYELLDGQQVGHWTMSTAPCPAC